MKDARRIRLDVAELEAIRLWDETFTFHAESATNAARSAETKDARADAVDILCDTWEVLTGERYWRPILKGKREGQRRYSKKVEPMLNAIEAWVSGRMEANIDDTTLVFGILEVMRVRYNDSASDELNYRRGISKKDVLASAVSLCAEYRTAADVVDPSNDNTANAWHQRAWEQMGDTREDCMDPLDILIRREEEAASMVSAADL